MNNTGYTTSGQMRSLQGRGSAPRVLVCYCLDTTSREEYEFILRLMADLRAAGIQVATDQFSSTDGVITRGVDLQGCQWVIVIQTPEAITSPHIKTIIQTALAQFGQQSLQGVLRVLPPTTRKQDVPAAWKSLPTYDASQDYPRALAAMLLAINARNSSEAFGVKSSAAPAPTGRARFQASIPPTFRTKRTRPRLSIPAVIWSRPVWLGLVAIVVVFSFVATIFATGLNRTITTSPGRPAAATNAPARVSTVAPQSTPVRVSTVPAMPVVPTDPLLQQITSMTPTITAPLEMQDNNNWQVFSNNNRSCQFVNNAYDIALTPPNGQGLRGVCLAQQGGTFNNLAYQIDMKFLNVGQGDAMNHKGGIVFRSDGGNNYYWFSVTPQGCYEFYRFQSPDKLFLRVQQTCPSFQVQSTMRLTIVAQDTQVSLYLDGHFLQKGIGQTLSNGLIGVIAISADQNPTEVQFSSAKVWRL